MSRLNELIQRLCPNGVEFIMLIDICKITIGEFVHKNKQTEEGKYPVFNGGKNHTGYYEEFNNDGNKVIISARGANAGYVNRVFTRYWAGNSCYSISPLNDNYLNWLFLYYSLKNEEKKFMGNQQTGSIPAISKKQIEQIKIPIPPLDVQNEIVRILDTFTSHTAELQAELQARKEQYEYYRNKLLTFEKDDKNVKWMKLGELCEIYTGGEPPKCTIKGNFKDEEHPYPIWANGKDIYGYSSTYKINKDAVVISSIGANTGTVYYRKAYFTPIIRLKVLVPKDKTILSKYLYYYLSTISIVVKSSSVPNINANEVKKMQVPILPICVQQRIVSILDKFEALVNDLTEGIPAEIAAVQEQYEYYRNKLLTFKQRA
ncbi:MAG: restriction endonuclease subunit S [Xylanibacter rarus]